jgi:membrane dipeptidase
MIIIDAHEDIAYNHICCGRDYRRSVRQQRALEVGTDIPASHGTATLGLPDAILGRVALTFATLFTAPAQTKPAPWDKLWYKSPKEAYTLALQQWDIYQRLCDQTDRLRLVQTQKDLDAVLATWADGTRMEQHRQGLVLLMENADPILEPKQFEEWYERGVRIVGPAWQATRYCGGTGQPGGLTALGRELLEVMASFNAILDLSHMAEQAFLEALDSYPGVMIASHSNPRRFRSSDRHLSDEMIRRLVERGGVIGVVLFNAFLSEKWGKDDPKSDVPLNVVIDVIDYICQLAGSARHVGIGTDLDGGFGREATPEGIDTITDLLHIGDGLRARGYAEADIEAILSGNMLRQLRQTLPA